MLPKSIFLFTPILADGLLSSPEFVLGGIVGFLLGLVVGKAAGRFSKAKEVRKKLGI